MNNIVKEVHKLKNMRKDIQIKHLDEELHKYQTAYDILMEYWEFFPYDVRAEIDKELKELGL